MKNRYALLVTTFGVITLFIIPFVAKSQEVGSTSSFKVTTDLESSYIWRGSLATSSPTPNFQPTLAFTKGNFEIGVWGSTDFVGSYKEVDPYVSFTAGSIKFAFTDYNWNFDKANYFNYINSETGHRFEGTIGYIGPATMPISVTWNTMFYGLDKKAEDSTNRLFPPILNSVIPKALPASFLDSPPGKAIIIIME